MLTVRPSQIEDAELLAPRLRQADLQEIEAARGEDPFTILCYGIEISNPCFTVVDSSLQPVAIFGIVPDSKNSRVGLIWLLASDDLLAYSIFFLRNSRRWIKRLLEDYDLLWNYVDARNELHIRWIEWCGFTLIRKLDNYGVGQLPFYEFEIKAIKE
jgi:hypothetical protein